MTPMHTYFTVLLTFLFLTACGAKSTGSSAASSVPLGGPDLVAPSSLIAASSSPSVAPGGTATFSVIGGTAPYTWTVTSGGGTLSSSTGASVTYTASATTGLAYLTVTDSLNATTTASINVTTGGTGTTTGNVCQGNYAVKLGTYPAAAQFATSGTTLTGAIVYGGHTFPLQGTCTSTSVNFVLTETGDTFTGTFANPSSATRSVISGTYLNVYYNSTQTWTATPQ